MADTPFPIPRQSRQSDILVGNGGATYGGFAFKIFDVLDVEAWTKATGEVRFTKQTVTVAKVSGLPLDDFTVTFASNQPATTEIVVRSARISERSVAMTNGTRLDLTALEKEVSKQASVLQELRRDIDRAMKVDFGETSLTIDDVPDGTVLMKDGDRLVAGPDASDITDAQANAAAAAASASAASTSAGNAASSATAANTAKNDAQAAATAAAGIVYTGYGGAINGASAKSNLADADKFGIWDSATALLASVTLSNLVSSIFRTTRKIANAYFLSSARFWDATDNTKGLALDLSAITTAVTRTLKMANRDTDLGKLGWELISETVVSSAVAAVDLVNVLSTAFDDYAIEFQNIAPSTAATFMMRVSTDAGATWISTATYAYSSVVSLPSSASGAQITGAAQFVISSTTLVANTASLSATMKLRRQATKRQFEMPCYFLSSGGDRVLAVIGGDIAQQADSLRFYMSTGNVAAGTIRLYGVRKG
ncbi:hypothetical protein [Rhizobium sp. 12,4]|uniref:hypothetical protein n=1 Tax=Rhizobium sp. 12,4 TaxID=3405135 RepID=UPI003D3364F1